MQGVGFFARKGGAAGKNFTRDHFASPKDLSKSSLYYIIIAGILSGRLKALMSRGLGKIFLRY